MLRLFPPDSPGNVWQRTHTQAELQPAAHRPGLLRFPEFPAALWGRSTLVPLGSGRSDRLRRAESRSRPHTAAELHSQSEPGPESCTPPEAPPTPHPDWLGLERTANGGLLFGRAVPHDQSGSLFQSLRMHQSASPAADTGALWLEEERERGGASLRRRRGRDEGHEVKMKAPYWSGGGGKEEKKTVNHHRFLLKHKRSNISHCFQSEPNYHDSQRL